MIRGALGSRYGIQGALGRSVKRAAAGIVTIISDAFTDTDGTTLPNHTPDICPSGSAWDNSKVSIYSNQAKITAGNRQIVSIESGVYDGTISCDISYAGPRADTVAYRSGIRFRSGWFVGFNDPTSYLRLYNPANSAISSWGTIGGTDGQMHHLSVVLNGDNIYVYFDNILRISANDSTNNTSTIVGFRVGFDATDGGRVDNYLVTVP